MGVPNELAVQFASGGYHGQLCHIIEQRRTFSAKVGSQDLTPLSYFGDVELHGDGSKLGYNPAPRGHDGVESVNLIFGHHVARGYRKAWHGKASFVVYSGFGHRP
jgi:hypothetical protein